MKLNQPVSVIMTSEVHTVQDKDSLDRAISLIRKHHIRHLPVLRGEKVVGILSSTDVNRVTFDTIFDNQDSSDEPILEMLTIPQIMSSNPKTVKPSDSIRSVAEMFITEDFHAAPVVEDGVLKGIVSTTDVIRCLLNGD